LKPDANGSSSLPLRRLAIMPVTDLSIIIPAYNETNRIQTALVDLFAFLATTTWHYDVTVIDDGSVDGTADLVRSLIPSFKKLSVISLLKNQGKGAAVKAGVLGASGNVVMFLDADGSTPPDQIPRLYSRCSSVTNPSGVPVVIGSRALTSINTKIQTSFHRKALGRIFNFAVNLLAVPGIADTQCGCKMFDCRAAKFLFSQQVATGFSFDVEILMLAQKAGMKIEEIPINWINVRGSKVDLIRDSLRMFGDILRFKMVHRHVEPYPMPQPQQL
jgi:dolichyl-phosphate beta-glucosyltransferase